MVLYVALLARQIERVGVLNILFLVSIYEVLDKLTIFTVGGLSFFPRWHSYIVFLCQQPQKTNISIQLLTMFNVRGSPVAEFCGAAVYFFVFRHLDRS